MGELLRHWRGVRNLSQQALAGEVASTQRHVSFIESGRSQPSRAMVLRLARVLDVPIRERNQLLLAAGYAPEYVARSLDDPDMAQIRDALGRVLAGHEPYPAIAVDRAWNLVMSNSSLGPMLEGVAPDLLVPPVNCMRLALHPDGIAPRILNLGEWRGHLLHNLFRRAQTTGDPDLVELYEEMLSYPGDTSEPVPDSSAIIVELHLRTTDGGPPLEFFSTNTVFGTAADITVSELSVEAFFPANPETADRLREAADA